MEYTMILVLTALFSVVDVATTAMHGILSALPDVTSNAYALAAAGVVARAKGKTNGKTKPNTRGQQMLDKLRKEQTRDLNDSGALSSDEAVAYLTMADPATGKPRVLSMVSEAGGIGAALQAFLDKAEHARACYALLVAFRTTVELEKDGTVETQYPALFSLSRALALTYKGRENGESVTKLAASPNRFIDAAAGLKPGDTAKRAVIRRGIETQGKAYAREQDLTLPGGAQARADEPDALTIRGVVPVVNAKKAEVVTGDDGKVKTNVSSVVLKDALMNTRMGAEVDGLRDRVAQAFAVSIRDAVMGNRTTAPDAQDKARMSEVWSDVRAVVERVLGIGGERVRKTA